VSDEDWSKVEATIDREVVEPWKKGISLDDARMYLRKTALLTPCRKGYWGTDSMNARAFQRHMAFVPVVSTKNSYQLGVMNGDVGVLERCSPFDQIHFQHCTVPEVLLPRCEKAFAMTVHKSQGGEFGTVVIIIPPGILVDRRLLYTAVTRAKERLLLVGQRSDLMNAIGRKQERVSMLQFRLSHAVKS
jgi:exodeoxyribonuclease V alpha subunit